MKKKLFGWILYIPASFICYVITLFLSKYIVPLVIRLMFIIFGFEYFGTPVFFKYEDVVHECEMDSLFYLEFSTNALVIFGLSGWFAGHIASLICPSKNKYIAAVLPSLLLLTNNIYFIYEKWDSNMLYPSSMLAIANIVAVISYYCGMALDLFKDEETTNDYYPLFRGTDDLEDPDLFY